MNRHDSDATGLDAMKTATARADVPRARAVMPRLKKFTVRLDPADVAVLKKAYPRRGYNQAVRVAVHELARQITRKFTANQALE